MAYRDPADALAYEAGRAVTKAIYYQQRKASVAAANKARYERRKAAHVAFRQRARRAGAGWVVASGPVAPAADAAAHERRLEARRGFTVRHRVAQNAANAQYRETHQAELSEAKRRWWYSDHLANCVTKDIRRVDSLDAMFEQEFADMRAEVSAGGMKIWKELAELRRNLRTQPV